MTSKRPRLEIEYCTQCGWLLRAAWLAQELLTTFEQDLGEVALVPGRGGTFVVRVDGEVVWDRRQHGFPEPPQVKQVVRDTIAPGRDLGHSDRPAPPDKAPQPVKAGSRTTGPAAAGSSSPK